MSHKLYVHPNSTFWRVLFAYVRCLIVMIPLALHPVRSFADHTLMERANAAVIAAYILNISKLVEWPETGSHADKPQLKVCLLGDDRDLAQELSAYKGTAVQGKTVSVAWYFDQSETMDCQVLFVGVSESRAVNDVIKSTQHRPVLLISEIEHFLDFGGMIALAIEDNKLGFTANPECAANVGLKIHSGLLALAKNFQQMKEIDCL